MGPFFLCFTGAKVSTVVYVCFKNNVFKLKKLNAVTYYLYFYNTIIILVSLILADLSLNTNTGIFFMASYHTCTLCFGFSSSSGWSNPGRCSSWQLMAWLPEPRWTSSGDADSAQRGKQRSWSRRPRRGERSCRRRNDLTQTVSRQVRGVPASVGQCWFDSNCIRPGKRGPILMCQTVSGCWGVTDGQMIWFQLYHAKWEGSSFLGSVAVKAIAVQKQFDANCITPGERGPSLLGSVYVEGLRTGVSFEKINLKLWLFLPNLLSYWWYSLAPLKS